MSHHPTLLIRTLTVLMIFSSGLWTRAQLTTPHFKRLGQEQGLSQGTVRAVVQDERGFLWIATASGLNRYDGYQFKIYKQDDQDPNALLHNSIRTLVCDEEGRLWAGTPSGLNLLKSDESGFQHFVHDPLSMESLSAGVVNLIQVDKDGHIWTGHIPLSVSRLDPETGRIKRYACNTLDGTPGTEDGVSALHVDPWGRVWVGTMKGGLQVYNRDTDRIETVPEANRFLRKKAVSAIEDHPRGGVWVATRDHGLYHYHPDKDLMIQELTKPASILSVHQENSGRLWLGTASDGLWMREPGVDYLINYGHDPVDHSSLSDPKVFTIFQDAGNLLWFGTNNGLSILNPLSQVFKHYRYNSSEQGLSHNRVKAVYEDRSGTLWVGTYGGGLNALSPDRRVIRHYRHDPEDPSQIHSDNIFSIYEDAEGRLWFGSYGMGLSQLDRETGGFQHHPYPGALVNSAAHKVYVIKENLVGDLVLGTGAGLLKYDPQTHVFTSLGDGNFGPGAQTVRTFIYDQDNHLWAGTYLNGLYRRGSNGLFTNYRNIRKDTTSLVSNQVACIHQAENGDLWIGAKNGLSLFNPQTETFTNFSTRDGLPDQDVYGILEDNDHLLWVSTNNGLSRFNPRDGTFINFDVSDGLQGSEFNSGAWLKLKTGELAFGGVNGLNLFNPELIGPNAHKPPIQLTSFQVLAREQPLPDPSVPIELTAKDYVISFEFTALDYANPGKNRYAYKLTGLDQDWNFTSRPAATYTNLDYGPYTFQVKGSNDDGLWNEEGISFKVNVAPPFYRRTWFYALTAALALMMLYAWDWNHKRNRKKLEAMVAERTSSLREANEELELANTRLEETADHLRQTQEQLLESAHKAGMAEIATDILHNLGNGLNSLLVSADLARDHVQGQKVGFLEKACHLLEKNKEQMGPLFEEDGLGNRLLLGLQLLSKRLEKNKELALGEIENLNSLTTRLSTILAAQQKYIYNDRYHQKFDLIQLVEDVLRIQGSVIAERNIQVLTQFSKIPETRLAKTKVAHIMNHLVKNACEALRRTENPVLEITVNPIAGERIIIIIRDNGAGIEQHILERIFSQGYTTKKGGVGGGLHYCANAAIEMRGQIEVASKGVGKGAEFTVTLPVSCE